MKKFGLPLLALVALIFAAASAWKWRSAYRSTPPPLPPPTAGFERTVGAVGLVEASSENIAISTPVPGLAMGVYVKAGDRVKAGQKLFSLDDRDLLAELEVRRTALEVARQKLAKLEQAPRSEEIPPAEARVREAEARASLALLKSGSWKPDIQIAGAEVAQAEAQVRRLETDIERLTVRAPMAGEILQLNLRAGEYAQSGPLAKPLIVMGDTSRLHVRADVDENEAWRIRAGASAQAAARGDGGRKVQLEFVRFEPYVTPKRSLTGDSTERVDTRVLQVIYRFKDPSVPFRVGQQMDVFITTDQQRGEP